MTNEEREEYRLAALAAGYEIRAVGPKKDVEMLYDKSGEIISIFREWEPEHYDEDSFNLYAAIYNALHNCSVDNTKLHRAFLSADPVAIRGAIFQCAVAIGRSMEDKK